MSRRRGKSLTKNNPSLQKLYSQFPALLQREGQKLNLEPTDLFQNQKLDRSHY